ncbi:imelysin family protein [Spirulina sp. 06S082]|uniref:imelysin family protein n=1 Tax=Spirulina sp. 06S082 TaxID=3110248 RepID=UPI002B20DB10|nr:imelysin family protein [Spirulina sp. 06S082]MEA5471084.1 imelysin family protein [Spirulina sp. 06S082]
MSLTKIFLQHLKSPKIKSFVVGTAILTGLFLVSLSRDSYSFISLNSQQQSNTATITQRDRIVLADAHNLEQAVLTDFVDLVIIPTYDRLLGQAIVLKTAVDRFVAKPTPEHLKAARVAWLGTRTPWEQSEAFAFGPASSLGYDGDLDDWPVNETDVTAILKSGDRLTPEYVTNLQTTAKGFHTIELLLFGTNNDKTASDFSRRELELLKLLAKAFETTSQDLIESWVDGVSGNPPYRQVLIAAGERNNPAYLTKSAALEEIVQGMMGCLDEVANEKIGVPLTDKSTDDLESRFSHSSLNDFKNNLQSVENAYWGGLPDTRSRGTSISDFVAQADVNLDRQIKQEMQEAIAAIAAIPDPIELKISDAEALETLATAKEAILKLFSTMEEKVLPLVQG